MWESVTPLGFDGVFCGRGGNHTPWVIQWNIVGISMWVTLICGDQLPQLPWHFLPLPVGNCMIQWIEDGFHI